MDFGAIKDRKYKIESLKERIARLRSSTEPGATRMGTLSKAAQDKLAKKIAIIIDLEAELLDDVAELEALNRQAEYDIESLPEKDRRIIRLRDIDGNTWRKVSRKAHYSESHCKNIHAKALKKLKDNTK